MFSDSVNVVGGDVEEVEVEGGDVGGEIGSGVGEGGFSNEDNGSEIDRTRGGGGEDDAFDVR